MTGRSRRTLSVWLLVLMLSGCAAQSARTRGGYAPAGALTAQPSETSSTDTVLNVIATPIFLAFKAVVCAATVVIAAPGMAITALTDPPGYGYGWQRQGLYEGFAANCGPPYVLY